MPRIIKYTAYKGTPLTAQELEALRGLAEGGRVWIQTLRRHCHSLPPGELRNALPMVQLLGWMYLQHADFIEV